MDNHQRLSSGFSLKKSENRAKSNSPSLFEMSSSLDTNSQNDKRLRFGLFQQESSGNNATGSKDTSRLVPDFSSLFLDALAADTPGPLGLPEHSAVAFLDMELDTRLQTNTDEPNTSVAATASSPSTLLTPGGSSGNTADPNTAAALATGTVQTAKTGRPKAAHSLALLLRIGTWEFASKYEGDIVAKIYFGKCQLVWEIMGEDRKLKKLEINWSDVLALGKDCSEADYDTLQIVLHNPPRFFKETDTLPRKHTMWAKCADFTNWQAETNRVHFLLFSKGSLHKHWDKFTEMAQDVTVLTSPTDYLLSPEFQFFKPSDDEAQHYDAGLANHPAPALPVSENSTLDGLQDPSFPVTYQLNLPDMEYPDLWGSWNGNLPANSFLSGDQDMVSGSYLSSEPLLQDPLAPTKDIQPGVNPINLNGVHNQMQEEYCYGQYASLGTEPLIPSIVPASEEYIAEQITSGDSASTDTNMDEETRVTLQKLAQHLLSDAPSASDFSGCISRVASLCQLLQNDTGDDQNSVNRTLAPESRAAMNFQTPESEEAMSFQAPEGSPEISEDSYEELLYTLPRIASLPHFVIEKK